MSAASTITGMKRWAAGAAMMAVVTSGCAGGEDAPAASSSSSVERPVESPSTTSEPAAPSTTQVPFTLGEWAEGDYSKVRPSQVEEAESANSQLPAGQQWWKVMAEVCATADLDGETITTGWEPWGVQGDDGGSYPSSNATWRDFPIPQYPFGSDQIPVGECRKGWVMIALADGVKPAGVTYTAGGSTTTWEIP